MKPGMYTIFPMIVAVICLLGGASTVCAQAEKPIKIGVPYPVTGPQAADGIGAKNAVTVFFEEKGMKVGNRKIELVFEDDENKTDVALTKTKKLVEFDKVDMLNGYVSTGTGYAVRDYLHNAKVPTLMIAAGAKHSRDGFSPWIFRVTPS